MSSNNCFYGTLLKLSFCYTFIVYAVLKGLFPELALLLDRMRQLPQASGGGDEVLEDRDVCVMHSLPCIL